VAGNTGNLAGDWYQMNCTGMQVSGVTPVNMKEIVFLPFDRMRKKILCFSASGEDENGDKNDQPHQFFISYFLSL
jgi:hypothetical protein